MRKYSQVLLELRTTTPKPKDTLGISRVDMPQVRSADYDELIEYLKNLGIKMERKEVKAKRLRATQSDFNKDKIVKAMGRIKTIGQAKPLLVSSDNYIVDGHHRWLAARNGGASIPIMQSDVKIKILLRAIKKFPKSFTKTIDEEEIYKMEWRRTFLD